MKRTLTTVRPAWQSDVLPGQRKFRLRYFVTEEQYEQLTYYFEPESLSLSVLERDLPQYSLSFLGREFSRLYWETPWERINAIDNNFKYDKVSDARLHRGNTISETTLMRSNTLLSFCQT